MSAAPDVARTPRLQSLDVLRGVTIAAMMLVNKQGNGDGYAALQHVPWHGATPTDWIFPFFLFMVGVALPFSIASRRRQGASNGEIMRHAVTRALILFALGVFEKNFPFLTTSLDTFRIPGVLQRIAFCYLAGTAMLLYTTRRQQGVIAAVLLVGYWGLLALVPVPGAGVVPMTREFASQNWTAWVDQLTMGRHLGYGNRTWDANGLLSSLPSIVSLQAGVLAAWMLERGLTAAAARRLALTGLAVLAAGWVWGGFQPLIGLGIIGEPSVASALVFPINKMLWTSTFVLYTSGLAFLCLSGCLWLVDLHRRAATPPRWTFPFIVLGTNAIFAYLASGIAAKLLHVWQVASADGTRLSAWDWAQVHVFAPMIASAPLASLIHSTCYALLWVAICAWMYRRRLFLKL
ncbi:acyltransferase family protein [Luteitalea sp.]